MTWSLRPSASSISVPCWLVDMTRCGTASTATSRPQLSTVTAAGPSVSSAVLVPPSDPVVPPFASAAAVAGESVSVVGSSAVAVSSSATGVVPHAATTAPIRRRASRFRPVGMASPFGIGATVEADPRPSATGSS